MAAMQISRYGQITRSGLFTSVRSLFILLLFLAGGAGCNADTITKNGFDLSGALVPIDEILSGGPPRDGIPAIDNPHFIRASKDTFLKPTDRVLGIKREGEAKAYPLLILNWHEIVNDRIGNQDFLVSFCPLCGTGVAFAAEVNGKVSTFGVSGLLYNSDVLLYDRETESLWSQILGKAIAGRLKGTNLKMLSLEHTTWQDWKSRHPETLVLNTDTGFYRDYRRNPYADYEQSRELMFSVSNSAPPNYHPKEQVLGLNAGGVFKAYPFIELNKHGQKSFKDTINGLSYIIQWDQEHHTGRIFDAEGNELPVITGFWFAWYAFHPETQVFKASEVTSH